MHTRKLLLAALVSTGLAACGGGGGGGGGSASESIFFDAATVINKVGDEIILATYENLAGNAASLNSTVGGLNAASTESDIVAARDAWRATRAPWEASEGFLFGPVDSDGIDPAIDTWPLNDTGVGAIISGGGSFDASNAAADVQGFHGIEYVLFGSGGDKTSLTTSEVTYLQTAAAALEGHTTELATAWRSSGHDYIGFFKGQSQLAAMEEIVQGMIGIVDEVGNGKIGGPYASQSTEQVESKFSRNSLTDFYNNLQSVLNVYTGRRGFDPETDSISLSDNGIYVFVNAHDSHLADRVLAEIQTAMRKISLIDDDLAWETEIAATDMPFRVAISDSAGRVRIGEALDALTVLFDSLDGEVKALLAQTDFSN